MTHSIKIPFFGFYESNASAEIDMAVEQAFGDDNGEPYDDIVERANDAIDFRKLHLSYTQAYAKKWLDDAQMTATFDILESPREYNFRTDEIYCNFEDSEILRLWGEVDQVVLAALIKARCTSYDGFHSFYSPDISDWPKDVLEWETPQLALLVECCSAQYISDDDYIYLMEDYSCNGYFENWIGAAMPEGAARKLWAECFARREAANKETES